MSATRETIVKIIEEKMSASEIEDDANLVDDLGMDSLDYIEVVMEIEEKFAIRIDDEKLEPIKTMGELIALVEGEIA